MNINLYGMIWVDQIFFWCGIEYSVVVKFIIVCIGIGVGVKVYQCYFVEMFCMSMQQRQRNKVVIIEREYMFIGSQQFFGVCLQFFVYFMGIVKGIYQIVVVYDVQMFMYVEILWEVVVFLGQIC